MKLREMLKGIEVVSYTGDLDVDISDITFDSRKVKEGNLFICVTGFAQDGHTFIPSAIQKGAAALIVEKDVEASEVTVVKVKNSRMAMPMLAVNFFNHPTDQFRLIGITGTNGKTTTTYLIKSILEASDKSVGLLGTISLKIGDKEIPASRTTPEAIDLQGVFRQMADADVDYGVMEVSSHALDLGRVDGSNFRIGLFTNLTQDHLDFHKTIENYREAKKKLFYMTTHANIINIDDPHGKIIADEIKGRDLRCITFAIDDPHADIRAKDLEITAKGSKFIFVTPEYEAEIQIPIPGKFSVYNALSAASVAYAEGISKDIIVKGLKKAGSVPGRSEVVDIDKPYTVIIDYAHTPDGLENILKAVREYAKGRIITLFGCGGDRDNTKRPIMGAAAGSLSDFCIITSDNPRSENPMEIIKEVENGMKKTQCDYTCIENRKEAIRYALEIAKENDIILLAGKGHETYQEINGVKRPFDEREIVLELLKEVK